MNRQIPAMKDTFELIRAREEELRIEGAKNFWARVSYRIAQIHPDTEMTIRMFTEMMESEAEVWILNSARNG